MSALYHFNAAASEVLELFLESAVPMIAGLAEVIGLFIIVTSLVRATYHYIRAFFFHDRYDFHHEMSSGLTTALEFLMSAEIAKTFLLQNLESVVPLAATFALRALMSSVFGDKKVYTCYCYVGIMFTVLYLGVYSG